ncbi:putative coiled-coil protein SlyX [Phyllobacterium ifriqiyense]|uniref:Coiled-coil protein SlyX n=1 Tax=Phyllobacterium ifriqiyense TaxID=314238 RepID=A0ABU0S4N4_9HYPH|nr:hypothetical protein [Phyllobacterium ifriqiyense]MDQ0995684.1 putative coiled-coil protein SlyX [Phyllobacterium ifriqiyense]
MATSKRASYLALIRLQKLAKARSELTIAGLNAQLVAIGDESEALFKMQDDRFKPGADLVPPDLIIRRLETNRMRAIHLTDQMAVQRKNLLKISRTLDVLNDRLRSHESEQQRHHATVEIDEYISQLLGKAAN